MIVSTNELGKVKLPELEYERIDISEDKNSKKLGAHVILVLSRDKALILIKGIQRLS